MLEPCTACKSHVPPAGRGLLATAPSMLLLILTPKCPACLMAYGGVLAMTGVSRFITGPGILLLVAFSLVLVLGFAIWRKSIVLAVGGVTSIGLLWLSRALDVPWIMWAGVTVLVLSYGWEVARPLFAARRALIPHAGLPR